MKTTDDFFTVKCNRMGKIVSSIQSSVDAVLRNIPLLQIKSADLLDVTPRSQRVQEMLDLINSLGLKGWVQFFIALEINNLDEVREMFLTLDELKGLFSFPFHHFSITPRCIHTVSF